MNEAVNGVAGKFLDKGKEVMDPSLALNLESKQAIEEDAEARTCRNHNNYLKPLEKYEDVIADQNLFMETLKKLHAISGTKFMIPTIGGRELDLHRLFVEVTSRGGIEKILDHEDNEMMRPLKLVH